MLGVLTLVEICPQLSQHYAGTQCQTGSHSFTCHPTEEHIKGEVVCQNVVRCLVLLVNAFTDALSLNWLTTKCKNYFKDVPYVTVIFTMLFTRRIKK